MMRTMIQTTMGAIAVAAILCSGTQATAAANCPPGSACSSLTQPTTELVMPFDATSGKASYMIVSNPHASSPQGGAKITTHWTFWGQNCNELADLSMCLTERDTVVVDPTNIQAIGADNTPSGPLVNLAGSRGIVTVTAYETDTNCRPFDQTGKVLSRDGIVGTFTVADLETGYSFGNDAEGFNTDIRGYSIELPPHPTSDRGRYVLQTLNPSTLDASFVVMAWLTVIDGVAEPIDENTDFYTTYYDNLEVATSLPDVAMDCLEFSNLAGGTSPLIPDFVKPTSSGILALAPTKRDDRDGYLFAVVGQAVGVFGGSSHAKVQID